MSLMQNCLIKFKMKRKMTFLVTKLSIKLKLTLYVVDLVWKCFDGKVSWWCGWWCGWIAWRSCVAGLLRPGLPLARSSRWSCCRSRSWTSCRGGWLVRLGRSQPRSWRDKEQSSRRISFDDCDRRCGWDGFMVVCGFGLVGLALVGGLVPLHPAPV